MNLYLLVFLASSVTASFTKPEQCATEEEVQDLRSLVDSQQQQIDELRQLITSERILVNPPRYANTPVSDATNIPSQAANISEMIGFFAYANNGAFTYSGGQTVLFEADEWNTGGYSASVSIFRCDVPGLYLFTVVATFHLRQDVNMDGRINLMKDDLAIGSARGYTTAFGDSYFDGTSISVITTCVGGELIYVEADASISETMIESGSDYDPPARLTSFSGLLLARI